MSVVDIGIGIFGMGLISWVIFGKVKHMWHQVHMFKQLGGPEAMKYTPSRDEVKELVGNIMKKASDNKKKDKNQEKSNVDSGMYE